MRLYVGGLPADISSKQLEGRFASFGTVSNTKLVPSKQQVTRPGCRGFAYVDFTPKDDQSLHRCLSLVGPEHTPFFNSDSPLSKCACNSCSTVSSVPFVCSTTDVSGLGVSCELRKQKKTTWSGFRESGQPSQVMMKRKHTRLILPRTCPLKQNQCALRPRPVDLSKERCDQP